MNIELRLLATMLHRGDFSPIIRGEITEEHFDSDEGKILYNFITTYRQATDGAARFPSLGIVRSRFKASAVELPDPDPGDRVDALAYEMQLHKLRVRLHKFANEAVTIATDSSQPLKDTIALLHGLKKATEAIQPSTHASLATNIYEVVDNYTAGTILPDGIPWPWPSLTQATKGVHRKELIYFAGRPKSRKTFTAMRVLTHAVKNYHLRALVFSPEMPARQMLLRAVAHFCDLRYTEFKDGSMSEADEARLYEAASVYGRMVDEDDEAYRWKLRSMIPDLPEGACPSFDVVQSTGRDMAWCASQIEIFQPDIVLFDSLYRQRAEGARRNDTDWKTISSLSRESKDLVMEYNVAGLATHQLNRGAEKEVGDLSNMALADALGQDADGIYRVVTGKINGVDVSALWNMAGREVPFNGIMIHNMPCYDYSEIGPITGKKQVQKLMKQEEEAEEAEEEERIKEGLKEGAKAPEPRIRRKPPQPSAIQAQMDAALAEDLREP